VQGATLTKSSNVALAHRFLDYLVQPETQALLKASGIPNLPEESNSKPWLRTSHYYSAVVFPQAPEKRHAS
jgi:ABC-type Fe3+ transport system substrate-binding protein